MGNTPRALPRGLSLAAPLAQAAPAPKLTDTPPRSRPPHPRHLLSEGAPTGGTGRWPRSSSITPRRGARSALGPILQRDPRPRPCSGSAAPARVPLAVSGRCPGAHGPCPEPAAPSLLFSAAAHKIFSLTTVRARAGACLGNREGENRAAPPPAWVGRENCLLPQFPQPQQEVPSFSGRGTPAMEQHRRDNLRVTLPRRVNLGCQEPTALGCPQKSSPAVREEAPSTCLAVTSHP